MAQLLRVTNACGALRLVGWPEAWLRVPPGISELLLLLLQKEEAFWQRDQGSDSGDFEPKRRGDLTQRALCL